TRTVHCEADVPNSNRDMPVNTTAEGRIEVGRVGPAVAIPLDAASVTGSKAVVCTVGDGAAHKETVTVLGEQGGALYVDTALRPGTPVVTEGRAVLSDGDRVAPKEASFAPEV